MIERFWKPPRVAEELGISIAEARELMRSGEIRSVLYATTKDEREYYRTTPSAVADYQRRLIRLDRLDGRERNHHQYDIIRMS